MKRIVSLLLVLSLVLSFSSFAFAEEEGKKFETAIIYEGIQTEYNITVPSEIRVGDTADVSINGYWPTDMMVIISAPEEVELTSTSNEADKIRLKVNFDDISVMGKGSSPVSVTEDLSVSKVSDKLFGTWKGIITYTVTIDTIVESTISTIWSKADDMVLKGAVLPVEFNFESSSADTKIVSVKSDNPEVAQIVEVPNLMSMDYHGQETYYVEAIGVGTAKIEAELDTGEKTDFEVNVYELNISENSEIDVSGQLESKAGDSLEDLEIEIPVTNPDGSQGSIKVKPEIPKDTVLEEGRNEVKGKVVIDDVEIEITIVVIVSITSAEAEEYGFTFSNYLYGLQLQSFTNKKSLSTVEVPAYVDGKPVLSTGKSVFKGMTDIKKVILPDTVTKIDNYVFEGCTSLTSIIIPDSVTFISLCAFRNCTSLKSVIIPYSVTSIQMMAFEGCTGLTSVTISDSVTLIGAMAFNGCSSLESVTIPNSVTTIGTAAFQNVPHIYYYGSYKNQSPWGALAMN